MILNLDDIKSITSGVVDIDFTDGAYRFRRFNSDELKYYSTSIFEPKSRATAGVEMHFETDADAFKIAGPLEAISGRRYYSFDVFKNGELLCHLKNFPDEFIDDPPKHFEIQSDVSDFSEAIELGGGKKTVRIVFPFSYDTALSYMELCGASYFTPIRREKKLLVYGDSITQGFDSEFPSKTYATLLGEAFDAEVINKGIAGEVFIPELAKIKNDFTPEFITVAYGTNDWSKREKEEFLFASRAFYENLRKTYPETTIFAISPIWRKNANEETACGNFVEIEEEIKRIADSLDGVIFIRGFEFLPQNERLYADLRLHPNAKGFEYYAKNLINEIKKHTENK